jgi:hypothetical protein
LGIDIQASKVHLTAIEQVKQPGFEKQLIQSVDVVDLSVFDDNINHFGGTEIKTPRALSDNTWAPAISSYRSAGSSSSSEFF